MKSLHKSIAEYKKQLEKGDIQKAYRGLTEYMMNLKIHLKNSYPDFQVSGNFYQGYMDMTYFSFSPESLHNKKLKIAIVFIHEKIRFEVWLAGYNKPTQEKYLKMFKKNLSNKYRVPPATKGFDSIVEYDLADNPDFNDLESLTRLIESKTLKFTEDITDFLFKNDI